MSITLLTPILILLVLALAAAFAIGGYKRGTARASINRACAVASAFLSALISMVIGAAVVGGLYFFIQYKERSIIKYYKQIGMTEEMYVKELKKRNVDKKQIEQVRKTWRKVKAEPVVGNTQKKK